MKRTALPKRVRECVLYRQHSQCATCSKELYDVYDIDHKVPFCISRNNDYSNLQALCVECHARKSRNEAYWIRRWMAEPFCWVCRAENVPLLFAVCSGCRPVRSVGVRKIEEFIYDPSAD